jgi:hypothetical protein
MELFNRLPGSQTAPPGLERKVLRVLPAVLALGTLLPAAYVLLLHLLSFGASEEFVRSVQMTCYAVVGAILLNWMIVMQIALLCVIVVLMKGHAYVADAYALPDSPAPHPAAHE